MSQRVVNFVLKINELLVFAIAFFTLNDFKGRNNTFTRFVSANSANQIVVISSLAKSKNSNNNKLLIEKFDH